MQKQKQPTSQPNNNNNNKTKPHLKYIYEVGKILNKTDSQERN
jgi:hypothetical protein